MPLPDDAVLLADFNQADQDPIQAPWTILTGTPNCRIVANTFATSTGTFGQAYHSVFKARDLVLTVDAPTRSGTLIAGYRINDEAADSTKYGYQLQGDGTNIILNRHPPGGPDVQIGTTAQAVASGDGLAVVAIGCVHRVYYRPGASGAWVEKLNVIDSTYQQPGRVLLQWSDTTGRADNVRVKDISPVTPFTRVARHPKPKLRAA